MEVTNPHARHSTANGGNTHFQKKGIQYKKRRIYCFTCRKEAFLIYKTGIYEKDQPEGGCPNIQWLRPMQLVEVRQ